MEKLFIGALGISAVQGLHSIPIDTVVSSIVSVIVGIATLIGIFRKQKK